MEFAWQLLSTTVFNNNIFAHLPRFTAIETIRSSASTFRQEHDFSIVFKSYFTNDAITASPGAVASRVSSDCILRDREGIAVFEGFNGGVEGVGHV